MRKYRYVKMDGTYETRWKTLIGTIEKPTANERQCLGEKYNLKVETQIESASNS